MSNYTILQENTLAGFSETAGHLYLILCDAFEAHSSAANERRAFMAADRYERHCGRVTDYILRHNPVHKLDERTMTELSRFMARRWQHNFMDVA